MIRLLLWIGLVARNHDGKIKWPIRIAPWWIWCNPRAMIAYARICQPVYVFRNLPGVVKWVPGRLLPRRWGIGFFGLIEFGDRGH